MNLSDLSLEEANARLEEIRRTNPASYCAKRPPEYMENRLHFEEILREESHIWSDETIKRYR